MRIIRPATERDVLVLRAMLFSHITEHQERFPQTFPRFDPEHAAIFYGGEWERRLGNDPTCNVWLASDRDIRGFLAGEVWSRAAGEPPHSFFIEWLYVVPEHRKTGISRALFREGLIPFCLRRGIEVIEGRTVPGDTQWTERGWQTTAQYIKRDIDALMRDVAENP